jgi:hypothetical protein
MAAILEQEIRESKRERIERERKEMVCKERELKVQEPYMCPGQPQTEKATLKEAQKARLADKLLNLNGRSGNGYGYLCLIVPRNPEERFGPCVPVRNLPPCDSRVCPVAPVRRISLKKIKSRELRGEREFKTQLSGVEVRAERGGCWYTSAGANRIRPPRFDGSMSLSLLHRQFVAVAEHNNWIDREKATLELSVLQGQAVVLRRSPQTRGTKNTAEELEGRYGDHDLAAAYLKARTQLTNESMQKSATAAAIASWPTVPLLGYRSTSWRGGSSCIYRREKRPRGDVLLPFGWR